MPLVRGVEVLSGCTCLSKAPTRKDVWHSWWSYATILVAGVELFEKRSSPQQVASNNFPWLPFLLMHSQLPRDPPYVAKTYYITPHHSLHTGTSTLGDSRG